MIEMRFWEDTDGGVWRPMVICDVCEFPIDQRLESAVGIAVWSAAPPYTPDHLTAADRKRTVKFGRSPLHVHLGRCDAKVRARIGDAYLWEQIDVHLRDLCHNAGEDVDAHPPGGDAATV